MKTATLKSINPVVQAHSSDELKGAVHHVEEEMETLAALADALVARLEPDDPRQIGEEVDVYSWRLAMALQERIENQEFIAYLKAMLKAEDVPSRYAIDR